MCPNLDKKMPWLWSSVVKMQFLIVSRRKSQEFFPKRPFFFVLHMIAYQSALIPRRLLWPKKFLVTRLGWLLLLISFALKNIYLYMEQKQHLSNTKIKKKCTSVFHPVFLRISKIRQQEGLTTSLDLLSSIN